jgi:hypothetical protein
MLWRKPGRKSTKARPYRRRRPVPSDVPAIRASVSRADPVAAVLVAAAQVGREVAATVAGVAVAVGVAVGAGASGYGTS